MVKDAQILANLKVAELTVFAQLSITNRNVHVQLERSPIQPRLLDAFVNPKFAQPTVTVRKDSSVKVAPADPFVLQMPIVTLMKFVTKDCANQYVEKTTIVGTEKFVKD